MIIQAEKVEARLKSKNNRLCVFLREFPELDSLGHEALY